MRKYLLLNILIVMAISPNAQTATITPSGTVTICKGFGVLLTGSTGTGYSYLWYLNDRIISGQTTSKLSVTASGKYTVKITSSDGEVTSAPTIVNFVPSPRVSITYRDKTTDICATGSLELKANKASGVTYQWYKNWELLAGATQQTYTAATAGSYHVQVTPMIKVVPSALIPLGLQIHAQTN
jgi:hypothetical protein